MNDLPFFYKSLNTKDVNNDDVKSSDQIPTNSNLLKSHYQCDYSTPYILYKPVSKIIKL